MQDPDAIRRLTASYPQLRGYQQLPFALGCSSFRRRSCSGFGPGGPTTEPPLFHLFGIGFAICWVIAAIGDHRALMRGFASLQGGSRDIAR